MLNPRISSRITSDTGLPVWVQKFSNFLTSYDARFTVIRLAAHFLFIVKHLFLFFASTLQHLRCVLNQLENPAEFVVAQVQDLCMDESCFDEIVLRDKRTFDRYSVPVRSPTGDCYARIWYFRDITERKLAPSKSKADFSYRVYAFQYLLNNTVLV